MTFKCQTSRNQLWKYQSMEVYTDLNYGFAAYVKELNLNHREEFLLLSTSVDGIWGQTQIFSSRISGKTQEPPNIQQFFNETESNRLRVSLFSKDTFSKSWFEVYLTPLRTRCLRSSNAFAPCSNSSLDYCIPQSLRCDGVVNCMLDNQIGFDEMECLDGNFVGVSYDQRGLKVYGLCDLRIIETCLYFCSWNKHVVHLSWSSHCHHHNCCVSPICLEVHQVALCDSQDCERCWQKVNRWIECHHSSEKSQSRFLSCGTEWRPIPGLFGSRLGRNDGERDETHYRWVKRHQQCPNEGGVAIEWIQILQDIFERFIQGIVYAIHLPGSIYIKTIASRIWEINDEMPAAAIPLQVVNRDEIIPAMSQRVWTSRWDRQSL